VDILRFLDRRGRVLRDEFFEFFPISLFEVEGRGSSVDVTNGSKLEIDVYGEVVRSQTWEATPFARGAKWDWASETSEEEREPEEW